MSQFGLFGLAGIVVNDSIVLLTFYRKLRDQGVEIFEAITEAACQRLRAVLLTSLTTISGLLPILFETSVQAPVPDSHGDIDCFGLVFGTALILLVVPTMLVSLEHIRMKGIRMKHSLPDLLAYVTDRQV